MPVVVFKDIEDLIGNSSEGEKSSSAGGMRPSFLDQVMNPLLLQAMTKREQNSVLEPVPEEELPLTDTLIAKP